MKKRGQFGRFVLAVFLPVATPLLSLAQEKPLSLSGKLTTGFYTTSDRARLLSFSGVPTSLSMDLKGYVGHPDFLTYEAEPQVSPGAQPQEAGFFDGNGISLTTVFLRKRAFPLTISYANTQREQLTYGSLRDLSGLRSTTRARSFSANWHVRLPRLPSLSVSYNRTSSLADPQNLLAPTAKAEGSRYAVQISDQRRGWTIDGGLQGSRSSNDFSRPLEPELITVSTQLRSTDYTFNAWRRLGNRNSLGFSGGWESGQSIFNATSPYDQDVRYFSSTLDYAWGEHWEGSLRGGYTSSALGTVWEGVLGRLNGKEPFGPKDSGAFAYIPFATDLRDINLSGRLRYRFSHYWTLFGGLNHSTLHSLGGTDNTIKGGSTIGSGGVNFDRSFSWATFTGQYSLEAGQIRFGEPGASGTRGQAVSLQARLGRLEKMEISASFAANLRKVSPPSTLDLSNKVVDVSLGRRMRGLVLRGSVGVQSSFLRNGTESSSDELTYSARIEHRRFQFGYNRTVVDGISLFPKVSDTASGDHVLAFLLRSIPESFDTHTVDLWVNPWGNLVARLRWHVGRQDLERLLLNRYDNMEVTAQYRFRKLAFEGGYDRYDQVLSLLSGIQRARFFVRVSRQFTVF